MCSRMPGERSLRAWDVSGPRVATTSWPRMPKRVMTWMNRIVGIVLIGFGTYLIINVLVDLESMITFYRDLFPSDP